MSNSNTENNTENTTVNIVSDTPNTTKIPDIIFHGEPVTNIHLVEGSKNVYNGIYKGEKVILNPKTYEPYLAPHNGKAMPAGNLWKSDEKQREIGRRGGIRSGEVKRQRKTLREELIALLGKEIKDKQGNPMNMQTAMSTSLIKQAIMGNVNAFTTIRDTIGERPTENVVLSAQGAEPEQKLTADDIARKYLDDAPAAAQKENAIETTFTDTAEQQ